MLNRKKNGAELLQLSRCFYLRNANAFIWSNALF